MSDTLPSTGAAGQARVVLMKRMQVSCAWETFSVCLVGALAQPWAGGLRSVGGPLPRPWERLTSRFSPAAQVSSQPVMSTEDPGSYSYPVGAAFSFQ